MVCGYGLGDLRVIWDTARSFTNALGFGSALDSFIHWNKYLHDESSHSIFRLWSPFAAFMVIPNYQIPCAIMY